MDQVAVYEVDRSSRPNKRFDSVFVCEACQRGVIDMMQGIAATLGIFMQRRFEQAVLVRSGNYKQRRIDRTAGVDEDGNHNTVWFGHSIDGVPGRVVLVPVPRSFVSQPLLGIDATLVEVDFVFQELLDWLKQERTVGEFAERLTVMMGAKHQSRGVRVVFFQDDFGTPTGEEFREGSLQRAEQTLR